jgi:Holliday junction DNA helicase RuvA
MSMTNMNWNTRGESYIQAVYLLVLNEMLHFIHGTKQQTPTDQVLITNQIIGIQWLYAWTQTTGDFFLFPYIDENRHTVHYYIFDTQEQKNRFESLCKINGVWPKTAFHIAQFSSEELTQAIDKLDVKFFQAIPGIWPKLAKKLVIELKDTIHVDDIKKLELDDKIIKKITTTMKWLGYNTKDIHNQLQTYPHKVSNETLPVVIKRLMQKL